jgi:CheY-like chemotaxis protein
MPAIPAHTRPPPPDSERVESVGEAAATTAEVPVVVVADEATPPADPAQPQVLVWPEPTPGLADVLLDRGLASVALARPEQPAIVPVGTAVVLIDASAGPLRRKRLADLSAAVAEAALPLLAVVGLAELDTPEGASDPAGLLNCLVPSGSVGRVLIIEEDPALAAAFGAVLALAGVRGWHAKTDGEAAGRLAHARPDVVLRNLGAAEPLDDTWLRPPDGPPVPVLVYTADDLAEGHQLRLERGQTVIGLSPRVETKEADQRLAAVLARLAGVRTT